MSKNQTVSIPINIYSKNNGELCYNISYKNLLYNYSINKGSKLLLRFTPKKNNTAEIFFNHKFLTSQLGIDYWK